MKLRSWFLLPSWLWLVALFARNITNELTIETTTVSGINGGTIVLYGPPRTYGVELKKSF